MRTTLAAFSLASLAAAAHAQVAFYPLAGTNSGTPAGPAAISADGRVVVGWSQLSPGQGVRAIRWSLPNLAPENLTPTWPSGGASNTEATAISADASTIVGYRQNSAPAHAFILSGPLDNLPEPASASWATAISADGSIIYGTGDATGLVRWTNRAATLIPFPSGATSATPAATTPDGSAWVGYANFPLPTGGSAAHPVFWNGTYTDLGIPTGFAAARATAITTNLTVIGTATRSNQYPQAWRRPPGLPFQMLTGPHGETLCTANAVTPDGRVIVGGYVPSTPLLYDPCVWIDGVALDLKAILLAAGINFNGWELDSAADVSADGTMIAGIASAGGASRAWAARIVLPPRCEPDFNQDGNADQDDVAYLVNVLGGGPNPTNRDPDFNHDGNADQDDVAALVATVAGEACP